jgi:hypothetical protein
MTASRFPVEVNRSTWYYEYPRYIEIVHLDSETKFYTHIRLPLRLLRSSLARIAVKPKKRKKQ